jgi:hypothetical protein
LEDFRNLLRDAPEEIVFAYRDLGKEISAGNELIEKLPVDGNNVRQTV